MTTQLHLDLAPLTVPESTPDLTLDERYEAFITANPHILDALEGMADDWLTQGHRRVGVGMLVEALRWRAGVQTNATDYKINNSYRSRLVRDLIARRPEWAAVFELRVLPSRSDAA